MLRSFVLTIARTLIYLGIGFAMLHFGLVDYAWVIFILLPLSLGIAIGAMPLKKWMLLTALLTTIVFLLLLFFGGLEGMVCIVMSLPLIIPLVIIGVAINRNMIKK